jgi:spore maturation protein SpmB
LAWRKKVKVYENFIDGAKRVLTLRFKIIPYLVAILVAIGMFRVSGAMDVFVNPAFTINQSDRVAAETLR